MFSDNKRWFLEDSDLYLVTVIFSYNGIDIFCYCDIVKILLPG